MNTSLLRFSVVTSLALLLRASQPVAAQDASMQAVSFLVGCWQQGDRDGLREYYAPAAANMMTGLSQFWRDDRIVDWEFHRIDLGPDGPELTPHPRGQASVTFSPALVEPKKIVWENLQHDFPNRIIYERTAADSLVVTVESADGPEASRLSWRMARRACLP